MRIPRTKHKLRRRDAALRLLEGVTAGRALDAPCGEGLLARELVARGFEVWACDIDPDTLAAREGLHFDVADLNGPLPYPERINFLPSRARPTVR